MAKKDINYLEVQTRTVKRTANIEGRKRGLIPAVIYGPKVDSTPAFLKQSFFAVSHAIASSKIYTLKGDALEGKPVMIREIKRHPVKGEILHVDLYAPDMKGTMIVEVPLDFQGEPIGVENGGVMQVVRRSIELECPVTNIPDSIAVDISGLKIDDTLSIGDVNVPSEFKIISAPEYAVVNISEIRTSAADAAADAEVAAAAAEASAPAEGEAASPAEGEAPKESDGGEEDKSE